MFVAFPRKRADVERARSELCARGSRMPPTKANRGSFAAKTCVIGHEKVCWVLLPSGFPKSGADGFSRLVWPQEDSGSCVLHLTPHPLWTGHLPAVSERWHFPTSGYRLWIVAPREGHLVPLHPTGSRGAASSGSWCPSLQPKARTKLVPVWGPISL